MKYQYRWIYALVMVCGMWALGYFFLWHPLLIRLTSLRLEKQQASRRLDRLKSAAQRDASGLSSSFIPHPSDQAAFLSDVFEWVNLSGLTLQSMRVAAPDLLPTAGMDMVHLSVNGDFQALGAFIFSLAHQPRLSLVTDFSYEAGQHTLRAEMDVLVLMKKSYPKNVSGGARVATRMSNPFCVASHVQTVPPDFEMSGSLSVSLRKLRMVGYLKQAKQAHALLLTPMGDILDVTLGDVVGQEHGKITEIASHDVRIRLLDNTHYQLKMLAGET